MPRRRRPLHALFFFGLSLAVPGDVLAQRLDRDDRRWLDEVIPLMLPEEERFYRSLKQKADRLEFQKIFWARRNPDLESEDNPFRDEYERARAEADRRFRVPGRPGSQTDCGRVLILLGEPNDVAQEPGMDAGLRHPEDWTYLDRPGQTFQGGKAVISFDSECRGVMGLSDQLNRVAEAKIAQPNINYRLGPDGRLVKLVDLLPKPTPAQALVQEPRQDFPLAAQASFLKVQDGGTALLGLVRGEAPGLSVKEQGGRKTARVVVAAQALGDDGKLAAFVEQPVDAEVLADGAFVASFRMGLKPGSYTLRAGALDEKTGQGSAASVGVQVPNLSDGELSTASLMLVRDVVTGAHDPHDAYAAFDLGQARLVPIFGTELKTSDAPSFFYQFYDARVDPGTGKAVGIASLSILRDGKEAVARAGDQEFDTPVGGNVVGPVPLDKYEPGRYVVQLRVTDKVANIEEKLELAFEIRPEG